MNLSGKTAIVTGSNTGIGYETAIALAKDGYQTFASMRNTSKGEKLNEIAQKENLPISVIELDVDNQESIVTAIKKINSDAGMI